MKAIEATGNWDVVVKFDDGHFATFEPYAHGWGYQIEGLRRFSLHKGEEVVFQYDARLYRCGPQDDEEQVVIQADGYTQQSAAAYWDEAKRFCDRAFMPGGWDNNSPSNDKYWLAWKVVSEGWIGLNALREGTAKVKGGLK